MYKFYSLFLGIIFYGLIHSSCLVASTVYVTNTAPLTGNKVTHCGGFLQPSCVPTVRNPSYAEADNGNFSRLYASPGVLLGVSRYEAELELTFETTLIANTRAYVRVDGDSNLFDALLGGTLGNFLGSVLGSVLIGKQEIQIRAFNAANTEVLAGTSIDGGFGSDDVQMVSDKDGNYYLVIRPNQAFKSIRIKNKRPLQG